MELPSKVLDRHLAYNIYVWTYWVSYAVESGLYLMIILGMFRLAMQPLKGLQTLGMLVFKWAAAISVALAVGIGFSPHQSGSAFFLAMITQLQQTSSILILCLLLFVCFAIRPMGLSYRSRIFGVSLGLGIMAASSLVTSALLSRHPRFDSSMNIVLGLSGCATLLLWSAYFAFPEEKRRIIMLPTTSPFLRWNQISEVLGDAPGYVAIAGIPPEVFAPAELEMMRRASARMPASRADQLSGAGAVALNSLTA
ncbi:MAG: hypothetical protein NVSMB3_12190 [Acidobacteriaceae bacterium]